jgi:hypothetical protein
MSAMFRQSVILSCFIIGFSWVQAQQPAPVDSISREAAAKIEAPLLPSTPPTVPAAPASAKPALPVAPPMPGQLNAIAQPAQPAAAPAPSRIPDLPAPEVSTVPTTPLTKNKVISSTSSSGQFIVHGNDLSLRSAFSSRCEEISAELNQMLRDKHAWVSPIVVLLNSGDAAKKDGKAASMAVSQITHGGFHLQVTINLRPDLRPTDVRAEIIRALLAERILKDQKELKSQRPLLLPDWLFTGIVEALDYRKQARPSTLFAVIFKSGKIFGIEEIIEASPVDMDALSKTIYKTSCCALVLALLDQPEGGVRLNRFLASLSADTRPERELLNQAFPGFTSSPASLNKWWALQLANLSSPGVSEPLTITDTLAALNEALTIRYQAKVSDIPKPRLVSAPIIAPPEIEAVMLQAPPATKDRPAAKPEIASADAKPSEKEKKERRSFFSRLNPFSSGKSKDEDVIAAAIEEAAKEEAQSRKTAEQGDAPEPSPDAEEGNEAEKDEARVARQQLTQKGPKPLFERWFGRDTQPQKEEAEIKTPKTETSPPAPKLAPAPTGEDEIKPIKKPSLFNPLNWFRDNQPKPEKSEDVSSPEKPAPIQPSDPKKEDGVPKTSLLMDWQMLNTPLVAAVYQEAAVEESTQEKKRFFGLFGSQKKAEEKPEAAAPGKPEPKAKRTPIRIQPLFGKSDSKTEEPAKEPEDKAKVEALSAKPTKPQTEPEEAAPEPVKEMPVELAVEKPSAPLAQKSQSETQTETQEPMAAAAIAIDDYAAILKRPDRKEILQYNLIALSALQHRCAILFRPIVADYTALLNELRDGKAKDVEARLKKLRSRTQIAVDQSKSVRDLLDTHEANSTPAMSGLFDEYLRLPETLKKELPERKDPISIYLDALDREFSKP